MKKYTFEELNDSEFEDLINDLLARKYGWTIERFKKGKDDGVDGRLYLASKTVIIQSKHFRTSGLKGLINTIKRNEYEKAKNLNPEKYILATSVSLNPADKTKIISEFKGIISSSVDIFGNDEINSMLREFPDIIKSWYKLWAENSSTLELFQHPEIYSKEISLCERLNKLNKIFVETDDIKPAIDSLNEKHIVIITGEPGVGKTTLAEYLCQRYMKMGYSISVIESDISSHPINLLDKEKKVLYYYDDFLGSNYFQAISGNSDSAIVRFIEQIKIEPHKRLILTSRSNIVLKAELFSQAYRNFSLSDNRYIINISKYTKTIKGKILHSHLWHSEMGSNKKYFIIRDKFYKKIIEHRNFNPRLISFALKEATKIDGDVCKILFENLENPAQIWDHCYTSQLDEQARILVKLCVANGGLINEDKLKSAYSKALIEFNFHPTTNSPRDFEYTVKLVCDAILVKQISSEGVEYTYFNPSVSDYLIDKIANFEDAKHLINCIETSQCIAFYSNLIIGKSKIRGRDSRQLAEFLLEKYGNEFNEIFCYVLKIALYLDVGSTNLENAVHLFDGAISNSEIKLPIRTSMLSSLIADSIKCGLSENAIRISLSRDKFDDFDIRKIYEAVYEQNSQSDILNTIKTILLKYIKENINTEITNDVYFSDCTSNSDLDVIIESVFSNICSYNSMLNEAEILEIKATIDYSGLREKMIHEEPEFDKDEYYSKKDEIINNANLTEDEVIDLLFNASDEFKNE